MMSKGTNIDFVIGGAGTKCLPEPLQKYTLNGDLEDGNKWLGYQMAVQTMTILSYARVLEQMEVKTKVAPP
ncbi:hypothetical protein [Peribacillus glennii]|nr:hypothetical protein [Peribacillus glennii]